jgi:hypothetical protein
MPAIAANQAIEVIGFDNKKIIYNEARPNPMYCYRLKYINPNHSPTTFGNLPGGLSLTGEWGGTAATSRHPRLNTDDFVKGVSQSDLVSKALHDHKWPDAHGKASGVIRETVHRLLNGNYFHDWSAFASTKFLDSGRAQDWLSLENFHNTIHVSLRNIPTPHVLSHSLSE